MEAPGLTWIPTGVGSANLSYLVHHETGHQWFYGIVGNDQADEPFTDEAATDFLARNVLGQRRVVALLDRPARPVDLPVLVSCYYEVIYIQGGNFLDDLRKRMGNDRVLVRRSRLRRGEPLQAGADEDSPRHARRPRHRSTWFRVPPALPADLLSEATSPETRLIFLQFRTPREFTPARPSSDSGLRIPECRAERHVISRGVLGIRSGVGWLAEYS